MSRYVETFKVEDKSNKLTTFRIDDEKLLQKYKAIEDYNWRLENTKLKALPAYDDWFLKTKIRTYRDKVYTNFRSLNLLEDDMQCKYFTVISIDSLLAYEKKYYLPVYLENCAYKIVNKQMTDYFDEKLFED